MAFTVLDSDHATQAFMLVAAHLGRPLYNDKRVEHRRFKWYAKDGNQAQSIIDEAKTAGLHLEGVESRRFPGQLSCVVLLRTDHDFKSPQLPKRFTLSDLEKDPLGVIGTRMHRFWRLEHLNLDMKKVKQVDGGFEVEFKKLRGRKFLISVTEI